MPFVEACVSLGSNLGDRLDHLVFATGALCAHPEVEVRAASRIYETAPVGPSGQGPYLNAVLRIETRLEAGSLLEVLHELERRAGRRRAAEIRWGPRTLDLDLLVFGDAILAEPGLTIPHPRLHERGFVLEPLRDVAAEWRHPQIGRSFAELADAVLDSEAVREWGGSELLLRTGA